MRVVLFQSVANLGLAGQTVDVRPGYFRNYLEPRGLALRETPATVRLLEGKKKKIELILLKERSQAESAKSTLSGVTLTFKLKSGEGGRLFGSVTNRDIAQALTEKGIEVDRHKVELAEGIKSVGEHTAHIRLYPEVVADVKIVVEAEKIVEEEPEPRLRRRRRAPRGEEAEAQAALEAEAQATEGEPAAESESAPAAESEASSPAKDAEA